MRTILIAFVLFYLRFFARIALALHMPTIIGITGSVGKTSARSMLYTVLKHHYPTKMVRGNSETGLPLGILGLELNSLGFGTFFASIVDWTRIFLLAPFSVFNLKGTKYLVVEMGIDDPYPPKNMAYLLTILQPGIAVFLNVSAVHTQQFEKLLSPEQKEKLTEKEKMDFLLDKIASEKAKIITESNCKTAIINADDTRVVAASESSRLRSNNTTLTFGKDKTNTISYNDYSVSLKGTTFSYNFDGKKESIVLEGFLLPEEFEQTLAATILAAHACGISFTQFRQTFTASIHLPHGRSTMLPGINNSVIIDSSYNASGSATAAFLNLVATLKKQTKREVVFLFGDMRELGAETQEEHEKIAYMAKDTVDYLYCVGPVTQEYVLPYFDTHTLKEVRWFANAKYAGEYIKEHLPQDAIILVKGSQNTIYLEEAITYILKDKHDISKLCRQDEFWIKKKQAYFESIPELASS